MAGRIVAESDLPRLLSRGTFDDRLCSVPGQAGLRFVSLSRAGTNEHIDVRAPRGAMSIRSFSFQPREVVAHYPSTDSSGVTELGRRMIVGVRPCELRALQYLEHVFSNPPTEDPFFREHRESLFIVSVDCVEPHSTCFCTLVEGTPHATTGFDVNLTPITGAYVVEAGTDAGRALLDEADNLLREPTPAQLAEQERARQAAMERVKASSAPHEPVHVPAEAIAKAEDSEKWDHAGAGCVECGACTNICPTCHCFYLLDRGNGDGFERLRAWDSCMWSGYSRMAGGPGMKPNPRSRFRTRFANRFLHKYVWSLQQWNRLGCVGCGRCTEACPGNIDIRHVVQEVSA